MTMLMITWTSWPLGLSGGSQDTMTDPGPETTALIERGGPGTDNHDDDDDTGDSDDEFYGEHGDYDDENCLSTSLSIL